MTHYDNNELCVHMHVHKHACACTHMQVLYVKQYKFSQLRDFYPEGNNIFISQYL